MERSKYKLKENMFLYDVYESLLWPNHRRETLNLKQPPTLKSRLTMDTINKATSMSGAGRQTVHTQVNQCYSGEKCVDDCCQVITCLRCMHPMCDKVNKKTDIFECYKVIVAKETALWQPQMDSDDAITYKNKINQLERKLKTKESLNTKLNQELRQNADYRQRVKRKERTQHRNFDRLRKYEVQIGAIADRLASMNANISNTVNLPTTITETMQSLGSFAESAKGFTGDMTNTLESIKEYFSKTKDVLGFKDVDIVVIMEIVTILYRGFVHGDTYLYMLGIEKILRVVGIELNLYVTILRKVVEMSSSLFKTNNTKIEPQMIGPDASIPFPSGSMNMMYAFTCITTLVSVLMQGKNTDMKSILSSLADFGRAAVGFSKLECFVTYVVDFVRNKVDVHNTGCTTEELNLKEKYPDIDDLFRITRLVIECPSYYIDKSKEVANVIISTYKRWDDYHQKALKSRDVGNAQAFSSRVMSMKKRYEQAINSPALLQLARKLPMCLFMYGKPGVGKSILSKALNNEIYKRKLKNRKMNIKDIAYSRKAENEYWDGYCYQPIVMYDDMLQAKETPTTPNVEYMELIRIVNEESFQLHMSDVADKKNTFFTSEYIMCNSNIKTPKPVSLADPSAFLRRLHMCIEVKVLAEYALPNGAMDTTLVAAEALKRGSNSCLQTFPYEIETYKVRWESGAAVTEIVDAALTYDEFIEAYFERADDVVEKSIKLHNDLLSMAGIQLDDQDEEISKFVDDITPQMATVTEIVNYDNVCRIFLEAEDELMEYDSDCLEEEYDTDEESQLLNECTVVVRTTPMRSLIARFKDNVIIYSNVLIKGMLKNAQKLGTQAQDWLKDHPLCFNLIKAMLGIVTTLLGLGLMKYIVAGLRRVGIYLFSKQVCRVDEVHSFEQLCNFVPCERYYSKSSECKCEFYDKSKDLSVGSARGVGLGASIIKANHGDAKLVEKFIRFISREYTTESNEHQTLRSMQKYRVESNESKTNRNVRQMRVESNETQTNRSSYKGFRPESKNLYNNANHVFLKDDTYHNGTLDCQMNDTVQVEQLGKIAYNNMAYITGPNGSMNASFVTGSILMVPSHFYKVYKDSDIFEITNPYQDLATTISVKDCKFHYCTDNAGKSIDLMFIALPRSVPARPNIVNKFATANSVANIEEGEIVVVCYRNMKNRVLLNTFTTNNFVAKGEVSYSDSQDVTYYCNKTMEYDISTAKGDCGALVFAKNSRIASKVVGMHVAGWQGEGLALTLTSELIQRNLDSACFPSRTLVDSRVPFTPEMAQPDCKFVGQKDDSILNIGDCLLLGTLPQPRSATKSQINKSLIHEAIAPPTMSKAHLRPFINSESEYKDPMRLGIKKVLGIQSQIPKRNLNIAVNDVSAVLDCDADREVLSYAVAVEGKEGKYAGINRRTSPGYPYNLDNPGSGKHHWFGSEGDYIINRDVEEDVNELIHSCQTNSRGNVVFLATLKDERRPHAKVDAGKTRVFEAAPMHYVLAVRMYFLAFIQAVTEGRIDNEIAVGTNVYSLDWHKIGRRITSQGDKIIAGDFSNFDGSLNQEILWSICDIVNDWYDDGPINRNIREKLWEHVVNTDVLINGEVIRQTHSQPSGNPLTVIINSIFNMIVMRMAYIDCKEQAGLGVLCDFSKQVGFVTYGDDNVFGVNDSVIDWYNQVTITESLAKFGLTYTDEGKTGECIPFRGINEVEFLKRKFVADECGYFRAPLQKSVILEMTKWIKGTNYKQSTVENVETSLRELAIHGADYYNSNVKLLKQACKEAKVKPIFPTYDEYRVELDKELY